MESKKHIINEHSRRYILVDDLRIVLAVGVACLHLGPFSDISLCLNFYFSFVLTRVCVPLFFIISGFFSYGKLFEGNISKIKSYFKRILKLYITMTIVYFPIRSLKLDFIAHSIWHNIVMFIRDFLFIGSYQHLWYFLALIYGGGLLILFTNLFKNDITLLLVGGVLYLVGTVLNAYFPQCVESTFSIYYRIANTTRNGIFFGFPFLLAGYMIKKYEKKIKDCSTIVVVTMISIAFLLLNIEAYLVYNIFNQTNGWDMLILLFPLCILIFISVIKFDNKLNQNNTKQNDSGNRKLSLLIYEFHLLVAYLFDFMIGINVDSFCRFFLILFFTIVIGKIYLRLADLHPGSFFFRLFI